MINVDGLLSKEQRAAGLHLEENRILELKDDTGKVWARWSNTGTGPTISDICHEADQALEWLKSGIEFKGAADANQAGLI